MTYRKIDIPLRNCEICKKVIPRNTRAGTNRISPKQYIKARFCSNKCRGVSQKTTKLGRNNSNWKGGISTENEKIRGSFKYKQWRLSVFQRDRWTCQKCKFKGKRINAHHIESFNTNKKLIYLIDNGVTLCEKCHKSFHKKYGSGGNTLEQFLHFIT